MSAIATSGGSLFVHRNQGGEGANACQQTSADAIEHQGTDQVVYPGRSNADELKKQRQACAGSECYTDFKNPVRERSRK